MHWNKKRLTATAICGIILGYMIGRIVSFQEMWRLRIRADENQYAGEFFKRVLSTGWNVSSLLDIIPDEKLYIHGKKNYAQWLESSLDSPRIVSSPAEADAILTFDPSANYPGKRIYWLTEMISEVE